VFSVTVAPLQALLSLDTLRKSSKLNMSELESAECIGALHTLYSMALTPIGQSGQVAWGCVLVLLVRMYS